MAEEYQIGKSDANTTLSPYKSVPIGQSEAPTTREKTEAKDSKAASVDKIEVRSDDKIQDIRVRECDFARGRWVYDQSYPLYTNNTCRFIDEAFDCQGNGRRDKDYLKWRWQPQDCDPPSPRYYFFSINLYAILNFVLLLSPERPKNQSDGVSKKWLLLV